MAGYNEILVGRFNRMLQKLLSMKGPASMNELASTLQAQLSIFHGAENRYLESWDLFGAAITIAGVAGNSSSFRFRNPAGSNVIAVFTKFVVSVPAASVINFQNGPTTADLATAAAFAQSRFDARSRPSPTLIPSTQNSTPAPPLLANGWLILNLPLNTNFDAVLPEAQEFPLLPGDAIQIYNTTANTAITVSLMWRERFLEDSERV